LCHVRVSAGRRSVRNSHVGYHTCPLARRLRPHHAGHCLVCGIVAGQAVPVRHCARHANGLDVTFHAHQVRRGRASRVGDLAVHAVGLHRTNV